MIIEVMFVNGTPLTIKDVHKCVYDSRAQAYVIEDSTGVANIPREALLMIIMRKDNK